MRGKRSLNPAVFSLEESLPNLPTLHPPYISEVSTGGRWTVVTHRLTHACTHTCSRKVTHTNAQTCKCTNIQIQTQIHTHTANATKIMTFPHRHKLINDKLNMGGKGLTVLEIN